MVSKSARPKPSPNDGMTGATASRHGVRPAIEVGGTARASNHVDLMYNARVKRYSTSQARKHLADLLNAAEAGRPVLIERRGVRFLLQADSARSYRKGARPRMTIEIVDPAIAQGEWTWTWHRGGFRFARQRRVQ
jgi:hypothetical protein